MSPLRIVVDHLIVDETGFPGMGIGIGAAIDFLECRNGVLTGGEEILHRAEAPRGEQREQTGIVRRRRGAEKSENSE